MGAIEFLFMLKVIDEMKHLPLFQFHCSWGLGLDLENGLEMGFREILG
jgi:hypothetical protein